MTRQLILNLAFVALSIASLSAQNFVHTITAAQESSIEKETPILMIFSGSDWCKPCIQLRESIIGTNGFTTFVEKELVVLELDFPYKKKNRLPREQRKHNDEMAAKYNPKGQFPLMVLIDKEGQIINEFHYHPQMTIDNLKEKISQSI